MAQTKTKEPLIEAMDNGKGIAKDDPENNGVRPDVLTRFKPGNQMAKGHRRGKQKLAGAFVDDLTHEWRNRGMQALQDLDSKALVQACIAILPKDVLVTMNQTDATKWVINATPMSVEDWSKEG